MSAPHIMACRPAGRNYEQLLHNIASSLLLNIDTPTFRSSFSFTAQRTGSEHLFTEYDSDAITILNEIQQWEKPSQEYKVLLKGSNSCITIHYRSVELAKRCLVTLSDYETRSSSHKLVENGYGCLLRLSDIADRVSADSSWSWERETFPELPAVADSEWSD